MCLQMVPGLSRIRLVTDLLSQPDADAAAMAATTAERGLSFKKRGGVTFSLADGSECLLRPTTGTMRLGKAAQGKQALELLRNKAFEGFVTRLTFDVATRRLATDSHSVPRSREAFQLPRDTPLPTDLLLSLQKLCDQADVPHMLDCFTSINGDLIRLVGGEDGLAAVFSEPDVLCMNECETAHFDHKSRIIRFVGPSRFGHAGKEQTFELPPVGLDDILAVVREFVSVQEEAVKLEGRRGSVHIAGGGEDSPVTDKDPTVYSAVRICCEMSSHPALQMLISVICAAADEPEPEIVRDAWGGALDTLLDMKESAPLKPLTFMREVLGLEDREAVGVKKLEDRQEIVKRLSLVAGAGERSENLQLLLQAAEGEAKASEGA